MAYRVLEVNLLGAKDLKRVNLFSRMEVYAVVTMSGDPMTRQSTQPDPYGGRHPSWNTSFRFNIPPTASTATGCLHVLLRTERALGDRDVGEVIVPLADILAGGGAACDPGARPPQLATYQVRKLHRCEPRGMLNVSYRLGPVVAPQAAAPPARTDDAVPPHFVGYPVVPPYYAVPPYAYLPRLPQPPAQAATAPQQAAVAASAAAAGRDALHPPPPPSAGPTNTPYSNVPAAYPQPAGAAYAQPAGTAAGQHAYAQPAGQHAIAPPPPAKERSNGGNNNNLDFGVGLGAGLVSGAIGGMLVGDMMMSDAAAYTSGYRAGLADGGAIMYKNSQSHVPQGKVDGGAIVYKNSHVPQVKDKVGSKQTMV